MAGGRTMEKKIMIAVDDSRHSKNAVRYAAGVYEVLKDMKFTLMHVQPTISQYHIAGLKKVSDESHDNPEKVKSAPHRSVVHKLDHSWLDDPQKWAVTWRAYLKKHKDV